MIIDPNDRNSLGAMFGLHTSLYTKTIPRKELRHVRSWDTIKHKGEYGKLHGIGLYDKINGSAKLKIDPKTKRTKSKKFRSHRIYVTIDLRPFKFGDNVPPEIWNALEGSTNLIVYLDYGLATYGSYPEYPPIR